MNNWLWRLLRGRHLDRQLDAELRDHVERAAADAVRNGAGGDEARRQALLALGGLPQVSERCREVRGTLWLDEIGRDVAYALRQLRRQPAFWSIVITTLVLGIATSIAVFAVVNGILLRQLPYPDADRLISLVGVGYRGEFVQLRQRSRTMDLGAFSLRAPVSLTGRGEPERLRAALATSEFFDVLRVETQVGRRFSAEDTRRGAAPTVVLSYGLWQRRFGGETKIIGDTLTLDGVTSTVIGVMPRAFQLPADTELWLPMMINNADPIDLWATNAAMVARLRTGVAVGQAHEEIHAMAPTFRGLFPWKMPDEYGQRATAIPLREQTVGAVRPMLLVLVGSVGTVTLIICANVVNLLLGRGLARERELAIRMAVGATSGRLVRQLLIESLTVALIAGTLGIAGGYVLLRLTVPFLPADLPRVGEIAVDGQVLVFALGLSVLAGGFVGVLPALRLSRWTRRSVSAVVSSKLVQPSERRASRLLTVVEVALAVVLAASATLLVRSLLNLMAVNPGFRAEQLLTANVVPPRQRYGLPPARQKFIDDLSSRLRSLPGVRSVAAGSVAPFAGQQFGSVFSIEGRPDPATQTGAWPSADVRAGIDSDYLRVLGVPLVEGRAFGANDRAGSPLVGVVSRSLAREYWGSASPIGARIRFPGNNTTWVTIVGVAADFRWNNLREEQTFITGAATSGWLRTLYLPMSQVPFFDPNGFRILVRADGDVQPVVANLRSVVSGLDRDVPITDIRLSEARIEESLASPRFSAFVLSIFATVALFLGAIGVYGVMAYAVGRRTREFAVRLVLGANTGDVLRTVISEGARLTVAGVAIGLAGAFAATRLLSQLLFGVRPGDPWTMAAVAALLCTAGVLASYVPARRAMRVNPVSALQAE